MFWLEGDRGMSGDTAFLDIAMPRIRVNAAVFQI